MACLILSQDLRDHFICVGDSEHDSDENSRVTFEIGPKFSKMVAVDRY